MRASGISELSLSQNTVLAESHFAILRGLSWFSYGIFSSRKGASYCQYIPESITISLPFSFHTISLRLLKYAKGMAAKPFSVINALTVVSELSVLMKLKEANLNAFFTYIFFLTVALLIVVLLFMGCFDLLAQ